MLKIERLIFNPIGVNTYIVSNDNDDCIIIDPGCYGENEEMMLISYIERKKLNINDLIFTHGHIDHIAGAYALQQRFGVDLAAHPDGFEYFKKSWMFAAAFGWNFDMKKVVVPKKELHDNDIIKIGNDELKVILTPGHAKGSICLYCEKGGFVFTGDTLFEGSYGRYDLPGASRKDLKNSLLRLFELPDETVCYPGHGGETTIGDEKRRGLTEEL